MSLPVAVDGGFLEHYGKKGMKWGVRKDRSSGGSRKSSKRSKADQKIINQRNNLRKNRKKISDDDLKSYIERLQNEKKLKDLIDEDLEYGKTVTRRILGDAGQKVAKTAVTGAGIYAVKVVVSKKFGADAGNVISKGGKTK